MKNYVYIYFNEEPMSGPPDPKLMQAWNEWFAALGSKLVDGGNPFNAGGMAVEKSGVSKIENHAATGYSIVKVSDMDEAVELAKDCPVLNAKGGVVRVFETMPM